MADEMTDDPSQSLLGNVTLLKSGQQVQPDTWVAVRLRPESTATSQNSFILQNTVIQAEVLGTAFLENGLAISLKTKQATAIWPRNCIPTICSFLGPENENVHSCKNWYVNVLNILFSRVPNSEHSRCPSMVKQTAVSIPWTTTLSDRKDLIYATIWMNPQRIL